MKSTRIMLTLYMCFTGTGISGGETLVHYFDYLHDTFDMDI